MAASSAAVAAAASLSELRAWQEGEAARHMLAPALKLLLDMQARA
eukprot:COSAG01_NODE_51788_length_352_cov_0.569170_1_plen_44_part_01